MISHPQRSGRAACTHACYQPSGLLRYNRISTTLDLFPLPLGEVEDGDGISGSRWLTVLCFRTWVSLLLLAGFASATEIDRQQPLAVDDSLNAQHVMDDF